MERAEISDHFSRISNELLEIVSSTEEEQLNSKPATGGWSLAQIAEHLLMTYASVRVLNGNVIPTERAPDEKVAVIKAQFSDNSIKMNAPPEVIPTNGSINKTRLLEGLRKRISQLKEVLTNKDLSVTCTDFQIPGHGAFTRLEWLYFDTFHTQWHILQMKEILNT